MASRENVLGLSLMGLKKKQVQNSLYEFGKYFWSTFDGAEYKECWLTEYQCEMFMYSVRHWLPESVKSDWITQDEYWEIARETGGSCSLRDNSECNNHDFNMPPRHSKSTTHNVVGPVWLLTHVMKEVASVSHTQDLANDFNMKRHKIINSDRFKAMFGDDEKLEVITNKTDRMTFFGGGKLYAVGMKNFTGFGADLILNDDIVSSEHAKKDKEILANAISYWTNTLPTRRNQPTDAVVWNIMQRLAPGDVSGYIHEDEDRSKTYSRTVIQAISETRKVYIYPCSGKVKVVEEGEGLWTERFGDYSSIKAQVGEGVFQTQYQQNAINSDLTYVSLEDMQYITRQQFDAEYLSKGARGFCSFDFPVKGKDNSDLTGIVLGYRYKGMLAIYDAVEKRMGYPEQKQYVKNLYYNNPSMIQIYEDKANGAVLPQDIGLEIPGIALFQPGTNSKESRLDIAANYVRTGNVVFVLDEDGKVTPRMKRLQDVLTQFPFIKNDDLVDAFSQLVIYTYTDIELKVYGRQFNDINIVDTYEGIDKMPVFVTINKLSNVWKVSEVAIDYGRDTFVVVRENVYSGNTNEIVDRLRDLTNGKYMVYSTSDEVYNLLMGKIPVNKNVYDLEESITNVRNGLVKGRVKVMSSCVHTISDIETYRYSRKSYDSGNPKPTSINDGFVSGLRLSISVVKGRRANFY